MYTSRRTHTQMCIGHISHTLHIKDRSHSSGYRLLTCVVICHSVVAIDHILVCTYHRSHATVLCCSSHIRVHRLQIICSYALILLIYKERPQIYVIQVTVYILIYTGRMHMCTGHNSSEIGICAYSTGHNHDMHVHFTSQKNTFTGIYI